MFRKIIEIDENKCNGCGLCIPNCPEGAIKIIDGKARLIGDLFCDGLGACIGHCPEGAITVLEREAGRYSERKVMENIVKQGSNVIQAHLEHLKVHNQQEYLKQAQDFLREKGSDIVVGISVNKAACPGSKVMRLRQVEDGHAAGGKQSFSKQQSELINWPIQIMLLPPEAAYLKDAHLLISADCVAYSYPDFHRDLLKDKVLLVGCPKLDDLGIYQEKLVQILKNHNIKSITYAHMEVPCCFGLIDIIRKAISTAGKEVPFSEAVISVKGQRLR